MADHEPTRLVLGSASPRRHQFIAALGVDHEVRTVALDERRLWSDDIVESVQRSAHAKCDAVAGTLTANEVVLTADTMVAIDDHVMGQPVDRADAMRMVERASGATVTIVSTVVIEPSGGRRIARTVSTHVDMHVLDPPVIRRYVDSGEGDDKAGALALQGSAAPFVARFRGCWSNVVGLPVCAVVAMLGDRFSITRASPDCGGPQCGVALVAVA